MTDVRAIKDKLRQAIYDWYLSKLGRPASRKSQTRWQEVEDAILALDNAAYDRAYEQARANAADWHQTAIDRAEEIERLKALLSREQQVRMERRVGADQLEKDRDRLKRELEFAEHRLVQEADQADQILKERDAARAALASASITISHLSAELRDAQSDLRIQDREVDDRGDDAIRLKQELADARETITELGALEKTDTSRGNVRYLTQRAQDLLRERDAARHALTGERRAVKWALKRRDALEHTLSDLKNVLWRQGYRDGEASRLRKALETLVDRYHFELCFDTEHSRQECSDPPGAVKDAERALGGNLKPFKTDDEQLNEAERQRGACLKSAGVVTGGVVESGTLQEFAGYYRLRKAFKTLADRYHAQMCYKSRRYPHSRQSCPYVVAVKEANAALADESETTLRVHTYGEEGTGRSTFSRGRPDGEHTQPDPAPIAVIRDDRDPDIEAVLIGNREIPCADGCGRIVTQGNVMYRYVKHILAVPPLYATLECARRGRRYIFRS